MHSPYRRRLLIAFLPLIVLTLPFLLHALFDAIERQSQYRESAKSFAAAMAEADGSDSNWRWEAIQAAMPDVPDEENLVVKIAAVRALVNNTLGHRPNRGGRLFEEPVARNQLYDAEEIGELTAHQINFAKAVELARTLEKFTRARKYYPPARDPFSFAMSHIQPTREVASLMQYEVERLAHENRPAEAIPYLRGILRVADSLGEEPFVISQLVRNACRSVFVGATQRLLGLTEPGPELETLLPLLDSAIPKKYLVMAFRGERALSQMQFDFFAANGESMRQFLNFDFGLSRDQADSLTPREYRPLFDEDRAATLRGFNQLIRNQDFPLHEQRSRAETLLLERRRETPLTNQLLPSMVKTLASEQRTQAQLRCARVGIACELFRQRNRRWPMSLNEIPKSLLREIPLDPYDGQPLRYRILPDSVRIYSVGEDRLEEVNRAEEDDRQTTHARFELWNPEKRRLPPPPPRPEELPFPQELPDPEGPKE